MRLPDQRAWSSLAVQLTLSMMAGRNPRDRLIVADGEVFVARTGSVGDHLLTTRATLRRRPWVAAEALLDHIDRHVEAHHA